MSVRDWFLRVRALAAHRRADRELDDELAFHVERETREHMAKGLSAADARVRALARFGSVARTADQCRDERGTALVDDLTRDVVYAFRTFRRAPLAALTIVTTLAVGLGLVAAVFTWFSVFFLRVDAVQNPGELFEVTRVARPGVVPVTFTRTEYETLRRDTSVFADVAAMVENVETRVDGRPVSSSLVTGNFFQMLGVRAARGRALTPADGEPAGAPPIVLSHRGWTRWFAADPAAIGRSVALNGVQCVVVGVMPEDFRGLDVSPPAYWAPLALAGEFRTTYAGREDRMPLGSVVGRLKPGVSPGHATAALRVWAAAAANVTRAGDRPASIALRPKQGTASADWVEVTAFSAPIFFAFGLILMIGCANVANLLLARAVSRQREISIRLSIGASRRRIVRQLLTESVLLALASAACGFVVSRIILESASYAVTATMPAELAEQVNVGVPSADWRMVVFLIAGAVASTAIFGLAPALQATRIELVRALRGEIARDARPGRARHALIAVQVGAAALLLICAAVFLRSAFAAGRADPGLRTIDTIRVPIANESRRAAITREIASDASVVAVAAASSSAHAEASVLARSPLRGEPDSDATRRNVPVDYMFVSPGYFQLLDVALARGRGFTDAERASDAGVAVVSESTARTLWPDGDPLGQAIRLHTGRPTGVSIAPPAHLREAAAAAGPAGAYTVVGIARDVGGDLMKVLSFSGVYVPADLQQPGTSLMLRVRGDPEQARLALVERLTRIDPGLDHEVGTLRTVARMGAYILQIAFWVSVVLGALALALTVSGLFGVLSYLVEQRAKEIGVRMALGATTRHIALLVLSQTMRPVGYGIFAGGGLAAALATVLLSMPAASEIGNTVHVLDPAAYAASIIVVVAASVLAAAAPALRATRVAPIDTLRGD